MDSSSKSSNSSYGDFTSYLITIYFADYLVNKVEESKIQWGITLLKKSSSVYDQVANKIVSATIERLEWHH